MKKHYIIKSLAALLLVGGSCTVLSSCDNDDDYVYYPDYGNRFYDSRLDGKWQLTMADFKPVSEYDTNYLDFYGQGEGEYYYYTNSQPYSEPLTYVCQRKNPNSNSYIINMKYGNGNPTTMNYWFSNGNSTLSLQWTAGNETITYTYTRVDTIPW